VGIENPQAKKAKNSNLFDLQDDTRRMQPKLILVKKTQTLHQMPSSWQDESGCQR